ncbi:MAG TPA: NAD-dependent dihydropyrimidine dehydrogenase subunit PreA [Bacteriovoracaceae bacterium]|nr:NAD-dependent dihydropyrimidine dehydrogenase subunit PreA [Bacteriovoracaceae bacterium]
MPVRQDILENAMKNYNEEQALQEASRCLLCEDAPCMHGCPTHTPVKEFIRNIRFKNYKAAYHLIKSANILGASCARLCNADQTCKQKCTSHKLLRPIEINKLQQFVCDQFIGQEPIVIPMPKTGKKVAVVGAGPAGISVAFELARNGVEVTVFERENYLGGLLYDGIPDYRLPHNIIEKESRWVEEWGVKFIKGESAPSIEQLTTKFNATVIACGLKKSNTLNIPGMELAGVIFSKELLKAHKLKTPISLGKNVVIIGGGNSALDSAQAAHALGAESISVIYRRSEREMPAWEKEKSVANKLGISFYYLASPVELHGKSKVTAVECQLMKLSSKVGPDGRRAVFPMENTLFTIPADSVVIAAGESVDENFFKESKIVLQRGVHATNLPSVFATGDIVTANQSVVHSVADGRACAKEILQTLHLPYQNLTRSSYYRHEDVDISTTFCGIRFENPFILAAAPPSDNLEMVKEAFRAGWAGAVLKTTSIESNEVPLKYPMMAGTKFDNKNLMGLGNIDLISEHHVDIIEKRIKELKHEFPHKVVIASIMGEKKEDWQTLVRRLESAGADMIECSFSCPQGTLGSKPGFMLGQDPRLVEEVAGWIKAAASKIPVVIKITPQVTDIVEIANAVKRSGADAICASNSIPSLMGINLKTFIPYPEVGGKSTYSGYTGPAILPITLRNIAEISRNVDIPITGTGGPVTWEDAIALMAVGASNVQFCTGVMHYGFDIINDLCSGLTYFMQKHNIKAVSEIIGRSLPFITTHDQLHQASKIVSHVNEEKCINCGACYTACQDGGHQAIIYNPNNRIFKTDEQKCVGCAFCLGVCPVENCLTLKSLDS